MALGRIGALGGKIKKFFTPRMGRVRPKSSPFQVHKKIAKRRLKITGRKIKKTSNVIGRGIKRGAASVRPKDVLHRGREFWKTTANLADPALRRKPHRVKVFQYSKIVGRAATLAGVAFASDYARQVMPPSLKRYDTERYQRRGKRGRPPGSGSKMKIRMPWTKRKMREERAARAKASWETRRQKFGKGGRPNGKAKKSGQHKRAA